MVTGASTADLAVILIDARKGVLTQTRRHSYLANLIGIRNVVLTVNKMDLVGYDQAVFDAIVADYTAFADEVGIGSFTAIPLSGLTGDNVTARSPAMSWYTGPTLLEFLEEVPVQARQIDEEPFRMAVQWVNRPNQDFRGYAGTVASGRIRVGDAISVLPAGRRSTVARIVTFAGDLQEAFAGQSVTLTLTDEVDCSRGDVIASAEIALAPASSIDATLVWMADEALVPHRSYWLKIGAQTLSASISSVGLSVDLNSMARQRVSTLGLNDIGEAEIDLDRLIAAALYFENRQLGGFILIDKVTNATVAAGMVKGLRRGSVKAQTHQADIVWLSGKARAAHAAAAHERLRASGRASFILGAAEMQAIGSEPRVVREVAKLMSAAGVQVFVTVEVPPSEAYPGNKLNADEAHQDQSDEWVI
jgi:bifunctional enzyme CysN/CysC